MGPGSISSICKTAGPNMKIIFRPETGPILATFVSFEIGIAALHPEAERGGGGEEQEEGLPLPEEEPSSPSSLTRVGEHLQSFASQLSISWGGGGGLTPPTHPHGPPSGSSAQVSLGQKNSSAPLTTQGLLRGGLPHSPPPPPHPLDPPHPPPP